MIIPEHSEGNLGTPFCANSNPKHISKISGASCDFCQTASMLKHLANENRLRILTRLLDGEASVGELADTARLAQSATSQHLSKLREAGMIKSRRDAQRIYYRIADDRLINLLTAMCAIHHIKGVAFDTAN